MEEFDSLEWDDNKCLANIAKHFLDFADAVHVLRGNCLMIPAKTVAGETRKIALGMLDDVCVAIVYTRRGSALRLISMRKARYGEQKRYDEVFGD
jgi:uncharacterized DUF497 family protein